MVTPMLMQFRHPFAKPHRCHQIDFELFNRLRFVKVGAAVGHKQRGVVDYAAQVMPSSGDRSVKNSVTTGLIGQFALHCDGLHAQSANFVAQLLGFCG